MASSVRLASVRRRLVGASSFADVERGPHVAQGSPLRDDQLVVSGSLRDDLARRAICYEECCLFFVRMARQRVNDVFRSRQLVRLLPWVFVRQFSAGLFYGRLRRSGPSVAVAVALIFWQYFNCFLPCFFARQPIRPWAIAGLGDVVAILLFEHRPLVGPRS